ncbi:MULTISPECIES: hypothetical protein [Streptomyces]|uniref:Uncharacterized protein n=1 Tax=Streptomyces himastatinicus ATCC 53653 TaxID=457427 RepID=D9WPY7_9ACTN|nr:MULTISPECIES: hypothetical protein [Streptomyces]EFL23991.1 hypothetical protein SSOG_03705 [Streptomyces himastatinicus ATCC 53653]
MSDEKRSVSDQELSDLLQDLEEMLRYLEETVAGLDQLAKTLGDDFKGPAATAHKKLQRDAYRDAVRVRQMLLHVEDATKRRGESLGERYLELLHRFQSLQRSSDASD